MKLLIVALICFHKCSLYEFEAFDMMENGTSVDSVNRDIFHISLNLFYATVSNFHQVCVVCILKSLQNAESSNRGRCKYFGEKRTRRFDL